MECAYYFESAPSWVNKMFELFDSEADIRIDTGTSLPHWYQPGVSYFVTFRTEDSIPVEVGRQWHRQREDWLKRHGITVSNGNWRNQLDRLNIEHRREFHETFSRQYLEALDKGHGECVLRRSELSQIVANSLLHFDGQRYHMGDFVVMPNHVHLIVCLLGDTEIVAQCTSWKRFTAKAINELLGRKGRFWQEESFDHLIRSPEQFSAIQRYIANNPNGLKACEYHLYQFEKRHTFSTKVAGTFHVPSASASPVAAAASQTQNKPNPHELRSDTGEPVQADDGTPDGTALKVAGTFHVPSAVSQPENRPKPHESPRDTNDVNQSYDGTRDGTWNVPTTLEEDR